MTDDAQELEVAEEVVDEQAEAQEAEPTAPSASLTLKRGGAETDIAFAFVAPAMVGRFDPAVGPIDVDLGSIDESVYVSRKHARIDCEDGVWKISDLGSSNGTFLLRDDFERVEESELHEGDEVAFGNARFVFRVA
jgi:hypothetical protein